MTFQDYLAKTRIIATEEKGVLDTLSSLPLDKITIRAAKNSLQVMIKTASEKLKRYCSFITVLSFQMKAETLFAYWRIVKPSMMKWRMRYTMP